VAVLCERHPGLRIVIDHLSKPPIGRSDREPWASLLAQAAEFPNVYAKVSGLYPGGDDPRRWSVEDIRPIVHYAVELFGTERLMFGSDWPICEVAGGYGAVVGALFDILRTSQGRSARSPWGHGFVGLRPGGAGAMIDLFGRFPGLAGSTFRLTSARALPSSAPASSWT